MVMKKASGGDSQGAGLELLDPLDLTLMTATACSMYSRKEFGPLGFSHQGN
jgi:hypothetical protein